MSRQPLSPQGYNIKDRPVNANPFWQTTPAEAIGEVTAGANTIDAGVPATATVESVDNPDTGKTDLRFTFGIPEGRPGEAGEPGRGIGAVAAETNTGSGVGVRVGETENDQNNEVDLTFHFDFPTEGSGGSQSLKFVPLGTYVAGGGAVNPLRPSLVSQMLKYPVVGFGVAYRGDRDEVTSRDIQTLIPASDLTSMPRIHLCKTVPTRYGCNAVLCVEVSQRPNGTEIVYANNVKYTAGLTSIAIHGKTYYVNATTDNPAGYIAFGLCVWGVTLEGEGPAHE